MCCAALDEGTPVLDNGAQGVVVPHVDTPEQARHVAATFRFPPQGHRSWGGPIAAYGFHVPEHVVAQEEIDREVLIIAMIETAQAVGNAEAIAATPGVDCLLIGNFDFTAEIGISGQIAHPRVVVAYDAMIAARRKEGKYAGLGGITDEEWTARYIGMGCRYIATGSDQGFLLSAATARAKFLSGLPTRSCADAHPRPPADLTAPAVRVADCMNVYVFSRQPMFFRVLQGADDRMSRAITSVDVAKAAGVSQAAVSRAFTPGSRIASATREHVCRIAAEMGYKRNAIARSLITQKSRLIAVVMGDLHNPFYPELLDGINARLQRRGNHALLFSTGDGMTADDAVHAALEYRVDGIVTISTGLTPGMMKMVMGKEMRVVQVDHSTGTPFCLNVACDNVAGARTAAEFLITAGFKRIGLLGGKPGTPTAVERREGFLERLRRESWVEVTEMAGDFTYAGGYIAAERLLRHQRPPEALFCANDIMALAAIDVARHRVGLRVPEDLSVMGFDDIPAAAWPGFGLTTIRQPVGAIAEAAVDLLCGEGTRRGHGGERRIAGQLILRNSVQVRNTETPAAMPVAVRRR